jgi:hypothetical protein
MASLRLNLPTIAWPKWKDEDMERVNASRAQYQREAKWVSRELYGGGILFTRDTPWDKAQARLDKIGPRNIGFLSCSRTYGRDGCELPLDHFADIISAFYIPSCSSEQLPNWIRLEYAGHTYSTWYRNPDTGLFDGVGECQLVGSLCEKGSSGFSTLHHSRRAMDNITKSFVHTQDTFIGPYEGHERWQRLVLIQPCIPKMKLNSHQFRLIFDRPTDVIAECVELDEYWRSSETNPLLHPKRDFVGWLEVPEYAIQQSPGPPLVSFEDRYSTIMYSALHQRREPSEPHEDSY